jgi:hypothetical protein
MRSSKGEGKHGIHKGLSCSISWSSWSELKKIARVEATGMMETDGEQVCNLGSLGTVLFLSSLFVAQSQH